MKRSEDIQLTHPLDSAQIDDAAAVLCDAFYDYPVMRFVLGSGGDYGRRLRTLVHLSLAARWLRGDPMLGIRDTDGELAGVALVTSPGEREAPAALTTVRETTWEVLGQEERRRHEVYGAAHGRFRIDSPHHHLNMIGVRRSRAGTGLGRRLLDAVFQLALNHPDSSGVSLDTEDPRNVALYEHFGYRVMGQARVSESLITWVMYKAK